MPIYAVGFARFNLPEGSQDLMLNGFKPYAEGWINQTILLYAILRALVYAWWRRESRHWQYIHSTARKHVAVSRQGVNSQTLHWQSCLLYTSDAADA